MKSFSKKDIRVVPEESEMSAYLMVFHKEETHSFYMALSADGYNFTAVNNAQPVVAGDTIAEQKGIRDPYICRGPDGAFYVTMTDLHFQGKKAGFRTTEYQRPKEIYGSGNNRAMVLMKSFDLINWLHTDIRIDTLAASLNDIGCVWAPEVVFNPELGNPMIYYAMRIKNGPIKMYYVYANKAFNKIETLPKLLYEHPESKISVLDGDITKIGKQYFMFYAVNEGHGKGGIKRAVSDRLDGGYRYESRWYDYETKSCEAPNVWKRIGENKWVLMYDAFQIYPNNFGFAETSDFTAFKNLGHFNEGSMKATNFLPKHGAVIQITKAEAETVAKHWGVSMKFLTPKAFRKQVASAKNHEQ